MSIFGTCTHFVSSSVLVTSRFREGSLFVFMFWFVLPPSFGLASLVAFETRSVVVHFWDLYSLLASFVLVTFRFSEGFMYIFILGCFRFVILL